MTSRRNVTVALVRTGTANLASVCAAVRRLGASPVVTEDPAVVRGCDRLILPGVGTFEAAMTRLEELGLSQPLRQRLEVGAPTLAICLGMQILCNASEESPGRAGLGIIDETIEAFEGPLRVPQLGWNSVSAKGECRFLEDDHFYFANSFRLRRPPRGWRWASSDYGGEFVAALEKGAVLACQFHPELSGEAGLALIRRWIDSAKGGAAC